MTTWGTQRQSPILPQSSKLVSPQWVGHSLFSLFWQKVKAEQTSKEAKAGLRPDDCVQTEQALQVDEKLGGRGQVEGGQAEGES